MNPLVAGVALVFVVLAFLALQRGRIISAAEARKHLASGARVIDVRSTGEYQEVHVSGAINIPLAEMREALPRLVANKQQVLLLHCLSGGRSAIAKKQARRLGYGNAFNLGSLRRARALLQSTRPAGS